jgi:hypothetical protein
MNFSRFQKIEARNNYVKIQHCGQANYLKNKAVTPKRHGKDGAATAKNAIPNPLYNAATLQDNPCR